MPLGEGFISWREYVHATRQAFPGVPIELELFRHIGGYFQHTAELFKGRMDNTRVFRVMATALGLGPSEQRAGQR